MLKVQSDKCINPNMSRFKIVWLTLLCFLYSGNLVAETTNNSLKMLLAILPELDTDNDSLPDQKFIQLDSKGRIVRLKLRNSLKRNKLDADLSFLTSLQQINLLQGT